MKKEEFFLKKSITTKQKKLKKIKDLKTKILNGATGFDILFETENEYNMLYLFDRIEKSMLKDIGGYRIIDNDMKDFGDEILKALNMEIHSIEQDIKYQKYKRDRISNKAK
jgi:hypothetical protein